jgi:hypothetical protein
MEPRPDERGIAPCRRSCGRSPKGFNGAALKASAESHNEEEPAHHSGDASMRPRSYEHGIVGMHFDGQLVAHTSTEPCSDEHGILASTRALFGHALLQWGRALMSTESWPAPEFCVAKISLQWSRALMAESWRTLARS